VKIFLLGLVLALGCTGDHVVGSTTNAPDASMPVDGNGSRDGNAIDASTDAGMCGGRREPCCSTGMQCQNGLCCQGGICR
jgi:hypothetical protein